jgi:oligopeptidase B
MVAFFSKFLTFIQIFTLVVFFLGIDMNIKANNHKSPTAQKREMQIKMHGTVLVDHYAWMRDAKWPLVESEEILAHIKDENRFADQYLNQYSTQRSKVLEELKSRIMQTHQTPYIRHKEYYYYSKFISGQEHGIFCRKHGSEQGQEEIILDVNEIAKGQSFTSIGAAITSPDNRYFAYSVDHKGDERYTVYVMNLSEGGKLLEDTIDDIIGGVVWHEKICGFFYSKLNDQWRPDKVFFHRIGSNCVNDKLIYQELDKKFTVKPVQSNSCDYIFLSISGHNSSEFLAINQQSMVPLVVLPRKEGTTYDIEHHGDFFYLRINDSGSNFRLAKLPIVDLGSKFELQGYIDEESSLYLESFDVTQNYMILNYSDKGVPLIQVRSMRNADSKRLIFPEVAYSGYGYCANFEDDDIRVNYSSLACPGTVFRYDFSQASLTVLKKNEFPGFDASKYCVRRLEADNCGVKIPITVFFNKDFKISTESPLYITGYGSYGSGVPACFRGSAISLVDRGLIFAIAHVRGGDELGHHWYESGKFLQKKNTFEDFIACTEHLIKLGYGKAGNIAIRGGSAGGMLIGVVLNKRPDLYRCAVLDVPFVDVLNTMLDSSLPLTTGEYDEWGNPNVKEYFDYMRSYCPYYNIERQKYPHIFATAGLSDPRVGYWEAAKWVAKIRENNLEKDSTIILKTDISSGHGGASGRFKSLEELADSLTFILSIMVKGFSKS